MKKVLLFFLLIFSLFLFIPNSLASYSSGAINIDLTINKIKDFLFNKKEIQIPEKPQIKVQDKISRGGETPKIEEVNLVNIPEIEEIIPIDNKEEKEPLKVEESKVNKKYIALTFDDGPSKANTPILLDILKKNDVKVTFFVLGKNASNFPDIIKRMNDEGHEIGNHSYNHPYLTRLSLDDVKSQVRDTDSIIYNIIGKTPRFFRPTYGEHNKEVDNIIDRTVLMWNVDSLDWKTKDVVKNILNVKRDTKEGSIILMHDIHKTTVDSIDEIIKTLRNEGFEFVTVSELLNRYQEGDYSHKVCYSGFSCK